MKLRASIAAALSLAACAHTPTPRIEQVEEVKVDENRAFYLSVIAAIADGGKPQAALAFLDTYLAKYPDDNRALTLQADAYLRGKDYAKAKDAYTRLLTAGAGFEAEVGLGKVYGAAGEWTRAQHYFEMAAAKMPSDPAILNNLGYAALKTGAYTEAFEALSKAFELRPKDETIRNNLLLAAYHGGPGLAVGPVLAALPTGEREAVEHLLKSWTAQDG